jgi:hypothetical protein
VSLGISPIAAVATALALLIPGLASASPVRWLAVQPTTVLRGSYQSLVSDGADLLATQSVLDSPDEAGALVRIDPTSRRILERSPTFASLVAGFGTGTDPGPYVVGSNLWVTANSTSSSGDNNSLVQLDPITLRPTRMLHPRNLVDVISSPSGSLWIMTFPCTLQRLNPATGATIASTSDAGTPCTSATLGSSGRELFVTSSTLKAYDAITGRLLSTSHDSGPIGGYLSVAVANDSLFISSSGLSTAGELDVFDAWASLR